MGTADRASKTLTSDYTSGPFRGVQVVKLVGNDLEAWWDVNFNGVFKLTSSWTGGHFSRAGLVMPLRGCAKKSSRQRPAKSGLRLSK